MIVVPYLVGLAMTARVRPLGPGDALLGVTWLVGYFAFNSLVHVLKVPAKRRPAHYPPLTVYGAVAGLAGIGTLLLTGWSLLYWVPAYAVLLGTSLYLASTKRERALLSGVLTVIASCGLMAVLRIGPDVPLPGAGVHQAGGGRVGVLSHLTSGQPVGEQVGHQQQALRVARAVPAQVGFGGQLVERVEG